MGKYQPGPIVKQPEPDECQLERLRKALEFNDELSVQYGIPESVIAECIMYALTSQMSASESN